MMAMLAGLMLFGAVSVHAGCPSVDYSDRSKKGYDYCGKENGATCSVGCNGGRVWYGGCHSSFWTGGRTKCAYMYRTLGPGESISCSNSGMDCDPYGGVSKKCYVEEFSSLPDGISLRYEDASCENNYNLGTFDCPIDCARKAHDTPECSGSNRIIFDDYYSTNHASWGCRCCKDNVYQTHGIWELYEYTDAVADAIPLPDNGPWLDGPDEALPKGTVVDIVIDSNVAVAALAVLGLLMLIGVFLCLCRGGKGGKPTVYRKVEIVSSVDEDEPMMQS